jgi:hypothetical protein
MERPAFSCVDTLIRAAAVPGAVGVRICSPVWSSTGVLLQGQYLSTCAPAQINRISTFFSPQLWISGHTSVTEAPHVCRIQRLHAERDMVPLRHLMLP